MDTDTSPLMLIPTTAPYDLHATLCGGQAFRWRAEADGWYDGIVLRNHIRLRKVDDGIEFVSAPDDAASLKAPLADYLRIDDDMDAVSAALGADTHLADATQRHRGLRLLRQEPWECLVSFICSANNSIPRITTGVEAMAQEFGEPLPTPKLPDSACNTPTPVPRSTFPSPQALVDAGEQALRDLKLGFRARYITAAAKRIADTGSPDLYALREADYATALEELTALNGLGDKIANCVMLFSLDKPQAFPVDTWIVKAMRKWYSEVAPARSKNPKTKATAAQMLRMRTWAQARFCQHAGYANQYMFHHIRWLDSQPDA